MADPITIIGGIGSIIQIIGNVTRVAKSLNEIRQSYTNVALNITLVASQLSTIRAALEALHTWRANDNVETEASLQLDEDLGLSLNCCALLITVIDGKLAESGYTPDMGMKQKIRYLWLEDILKEYVSNLEGQVRALQLLLTIFQCRTATEQKQQLANQETREIIEQVRAETMTLGLGESDLDDAISILSQDPSVHLDVDSILMKSPAYRRVYGGEVGHPYAPLVESSADRSSFQKQELPRRKKLAVKPPPPPPRRKPAPRPRLQSDDHSISTSVPAETAPSPPQMPAPLSSPPKELMPVQPPQEPAPQAPPPPAEIAPQPPPVPSRPKSRIRTSPQRIQRQSQEQVLSRERINVWDYLGPDHEEEAQSSRAMGMADSAPVFELHADITPAPQKSQILKDPRRLTGTISEPYIVTQPDPGAKLLEPRGISTAAPEPDVFVDEHVYILPEQLHSLEPPAIDRPSRLEDGISNEFPPTLPKEKIQEEENKSGESTSSLEGFRYQLDRAFQERNPSEAGHDDVGLPFTSREPKKPLTVEREEDREAHEAGSKDPDETTRTSAILDKSSMPVVHETMSIHSGVDLYDASVKDMPTGSASSPPSGSVADHVVDETTGAAPVNDEMEAEAEGLSVLNQQLASKSHDANPTNETVPAERMMKSEHLMAPEEVSWPAQTVVEEMDPIKTSPSASISSPHNITTSSEKDSDSHITKTPPQPIVTSTPASPIRPPPPLPTGTVSIPPIPYVGPPPADQRNRNSAVETSTASSGRDSSIFEASSTISSSEPSVDNTTLTFKHSTSNTAATSVSIVGPPSAREQAQADLRRLQSELAAAKARGDSKAAQASLQESIEVIRVTYLAALTPADTKKARSPRLGTRASLIRFPSMPGSARASALGDATAAGEIASVKSLLDMKVNIDARGSNHQTPLMRAATNGHVDCLDMLKQRGADEFAVDASGKTVLHLAVANKQLDCVRWLLKAYPPPRPDQLKHRGSILFKATDSIISRSPKNLREASDAEGSKPLHIAVKSDQGDMMKRLLEAGVNMEAKDNSGQTPLHHAIISDRRHCLETLLKNGASIDVGDARAMTPLHWAAKTGHVDVITTLLGKGADRHKCDLEGKQPIHQAAWVGHILAIQTLSLGPDDLRKRTKSGETLLHIACMIKNVELATYLLKNGFEVNAEAQPQPTLLNSLSKFKVVGSLMTPLHYACCKGDYEMALLLLDHDAWFNNATPEGATALMMATESEDTNIVNLLLSRGAKVNASMPGSLTTALHIAARRGDLETIQQLCRAGANDSARNDSGSYGRTPSEEATKYCTDKGKQIAVEDYFRTIRENKRRNARVVGINQRPTYDMVGRANSTVPPGSIRPQQPVSYAPWGGSSLVPRSTVPVMTSQAQPYYPQQWSSTYPQLIERAHTQPEGQFPQNWYDPNPLTHVESPPPYQAGPSVSARLANQAPVYRPGDSTGPKYS